MEKDALAQASVVFAKELAIEQPDANAEYEHISHCAITLQQALDKINKTEVVANFLGELLIQNLRCEGEVMTAPDKAFWLHVADRLGPDWIVSLDRAVNWMKRTDSFR
jgi:hypothetical protein